MWWFTLALAADADLGDRLAEIQRQNHGLPILVGTDDRAGVAGIDSARDDVDLVVVGAVDTNDVDRLLAGRRMRCGVLVVAGEVTAVRGACGERVPVVVAPE